MLILLSSVLTALALLLLVPTLVFVTEVLIGCFQQVRDVDESAPNGLPVAVLVPAHNEGAGIEPTIEDIKQQLRPQDRLVVVADNCTDDTASAAAAFGAEVTIRDDPTKVGKGYALDWGIKYLTVDPPAIVVIVDADCRLGPGTIDRLVVACTRSRRPIQSSYFMTAPSGPTINHQVAEFAWRVKNSVRPLGLSSMALPCQLMGTGMAFPWHIIRSADLSSGFIVEDLKLGLELAAAGHPPKFCPSAVVTSTFPTSAQGARTQRQRWEQGHLSLIFSTVPGLLRAATGRRDIKLFAMALDVLVPPLSLLVSVLAGTTLATAVAAIAGLSATPFLLLVSCLFLVAAAVLLTWIQHGRDILPLRDLILIVPYLTKKLSLYLALATGRRVLRWTRADRD